MNNLYFIKDKEGNRIKFTPNWAQQEITESNHTCKVVLKARQLGITTFFCVYLLDKVLWSKLDGKDTVQAGIIAHTLSDAQSIFVDKLKYTFDHLHPALRTLFRTVGDSAKELRFSHGSTIRVGTSLRSSTLNYLHISELGKICAKYPEKAREVVSGALQTLAPGQYCFIESTAEGTEGFYHDLCMESKRKKEANDILGLLDYDFFFFPWWKEQGYTIKDESIVISSINQEYFDKLEVEGIKLTLAQKRWYQKKKELLHEDMLREYPSYPEEAFLSSQEGNWYASQLKELYEQGKVTSVSYDKALPVHTASDLGQRNYFAMWFFQINPHGEIMVIDFFQKKDFPIDRQVEMLQQKGYTYGTHIWPHDARARGRGGITYEDQARDLNFNGIVLEQHGLVDGINLVRTKMSKMWFDKDKCKEGLSMLAKYKKKWNNQTGGYTSDELHDDASDAAAAIRYLCAGLEKVDNSRDTTDDMKAVNNFFGGDSLGQSPNFAIGPQMQSRNF